MTNIELGYVAQGYELPPLLNWVWVRETREKFDLDERHVPLCTVEGVCCGWGIPFINGQPLKRGKFAYEADLKVRPTYGDGTPRKTWEQLGKDEQWSWER